MGKKKRKLALLLCICMVTACLSGMEFWNWTQSKAATTIDTTEDVRLLGIDVSHYQGAINWKKVKADGVNYAIIRCGYGQDITSQDDARWKENADACTSQGIPFGTYLYSYATTEAAARGEANHVLRLIKGYNLQYPVYYDIEHTTQKQLSAKQLGKVAKAFCDVIEAAGYKVGIYSGYSFFNNHMTDPTFDNYDRWVARYNSYCRYSKSYNMWQFTSDGAVDGISGRVDMDYTIGTDLISPVTGIGLNETQCSMKIGESRNLTASVQPLNAFNKAVSWSTSDQGIASVANGVVLAVGEGTVTITAKAKENSKIYAKCQITVSAVDTVATATPSVVEIVTDSGIHGGIITGTGIVVTSAPAISASPTATATLKPTGTPASVATSTPKITESPRPTVSATVKPTSSPVVKPSPWVSPTVVPTGTPVPTVSVGKVTGFTYKAVSKEEIRLSWKSVKNAAGYRLYYYDSANDKYLALTTQNSTKSTYTVKKLGEKALTAGKSYNFKIKAYRVVDGKKYWGTAVKLKAVTKPAPVKITKIKRTSTQKATVKWKAASGAQGYVIYISNSRNGVYKAVSTVVGKTKTSYTIKGLKKGKGYYVRVCAYKKCEGKTCYGNYTATKSIPSK